MNDHTTISVRPARPEDVPAITTIYALDPIMGPHEAGGTAEEYARAFARIERDENQHLLVAEEGGEVLGSVQLTAIQCLIQRGMRRAILEAVFVHPAHTGRGVGRALVLAAIETARQAGCGVIGLTSNKQRSRAIAFYQKLGFANTHEGFKLPL